MIGNKKGSKVILLNAMINIRLLPSKPPSCHGMDKKEVFYDDCAANSLEINIFESLLFPSQKCGK